MLFVEQFLFDCNLLVSEHLEIRAQTAVGVSAAGRHYSLKGM